MCGIGGFLMVDGSPAAEADAAAMMRMLRRRGPDGSGVWADSAVALGHTRLAILDLSSDGAQPMTDDSGRYVISFNGEVYNFLELRDELAALGHRFRTQTDTEVILAAYARWGDACQRRFNGMWAFALWDRAEQRLFLSRDRFGIKPLFWHFDGRRFAFASEMKALLALPGFAVEFDANSLSTAIMHSHRLEGTEACLLRGVRRLPAGHSLTIQMGGTPQLRRWWNTLDHVTPVGGTLDEQAEQVRALFFDACRLRLRSDVPIATALSGGLDSSSVHVALAHLRRSEPSLARAAGDWQRAFVASYGTASVQNERPYAQAVVRHAGTVGVYHSIDARDVVDHLDQALFDIEDIIENILAPWLLYRAMRQDGIVVSIDGHGGDELFGGYVHQVEAAIAGTADPARRHALEAIRHDMAPMPSPTAAVPEGFTRSAFLTRQPELPPLVTRDQDMDRFTRFDPLTRCCYADIHFTTLPTILRNFDRCSMAHGVEVRAPFLDWRLVCLALGLPPESKVGRGYSKLVLRRALRDLLPDEVLTRKDKLGFVTPVNEWLGSPLQTYVLDALNSQAFLECAHWRGSELRDAVQDGLARGQGGVLWHVWPFIHAFRIMELFGHSATGMKT